ncbi:PorT family protein [Labilibacter sediminis]|nr:PorT family protein [Labilibacter sediminis]
MKIQYKNIFFTLLLLMMVSPLFSQVRLTPWVGFGNQSVKYSFDDATIDGASGINFGADVYIYLNENMALGSGFRMTSYEATASINDYSIEQAGVDKDGDAYEMTSVSTNIEESHKISAIEIPLLFRYQDWVTDNIMLFGATGPVFILPGSSSSKIASGSVKNVGFYPEWNLIIDDVPEYGFFDNELAGDMPEIDTKTSLAWTIEAGAEIFISKRLNVFASLYYQSCFSSVTNPAEGGLIADPFTYNGSLMGADDVKLSKMGIRVGVNLDLTPRERGSIKSIR